MNDLKLEVADFAKQCGVDFFLTTGLEGFDFPAGEVIVVEARKLVIQFFEPFGVTNLQQHLKEREEMAERGFKLIRIWRDQWLYKKEIVRSRLVSLFQLNKKLPARTCVVRRIDKQAAELFLSVNHLQGYVSSKFKYGLYLPRTYYRLLSQFTHHFDTNEEEILMAVMTFSNPRKFYQDEKVCLSFEMVRFATAMHFSVTGGFNKLLSHFVREKRPGNVMTYADADWSDGLTYLDLGFEWVETTAPLALQLDDNHKRVLQTTGPAEIYNSGSLKMIKGL